jgi:hypothetical protein
MPKEPAHIGRVRADAFGRLAWPQRETTNLYVGHRPIEKGEPIGPQQQRIRARRQSILVFADDDPHANFTHACRYLLYDAETGKFDREHAAQFPPFTAKEPLQLKAFHEPKPFLKEPILYRAKPFLRCPIIVHRKRYAILWSGMSNKRHLNDMEFLYRTLIDKYGFDEKDIYAMSYDGTLNTQDGVQVNWPGDGTKYRIKVNGGGTRSDFEAAVDDLKKRIKEDDLLLIHINNHGGYDGTPGTANFCTYPSWAAYYATDFADKLGQLPKFSKLIVMLEPCHAGGFNAPILAKSTAGATSVASAALEPLNSYVSADGNWDPFARDWIAAEAGHDCFGGALAFNPDSDSDGRIEAQEAFDYANAIKHPLDTPNYSESSAAGGDIALGGSYVVWWWWCLIIRELLERQYIKRPIPEFYDRLHRIEPELLQLTEMLDARSEELRKEVEPQLQELVRKAFGRTR